MADELVGSRIADRFTITRVLGQGGMATVYAATQDQEPRELALKIMSRSLNADRASPSASSARPRRRSASGTKTRCASMRTAVAGKDSYIAMELLTGVDPRGAPRSRRPDLSQRRAANILAEICDVLAVAHELGVVHRDLKPENVMIIPDASSPSGERVKVLDFGIAKMLFEEGSAELPPDSDDAPTALTRTGTQLGTPAYMSPEQCQLLEVDARSDIYTCGILLYQMMTGRRSVRGRDAAPHRDAHIREPLVKPSTYAPHVDLRARGDHRQGAREAEGKPARVGAWARGRAPRPPGEPARQARRASAGRRDSRKSGPHSPRLRRRRRPRASRRARSRRPRSRCSAAARCHPRPSTTSPRRTTTRGR